jgi:hypothetical protein
MDRQVKKDISIGYYDQENIRLLFLLLDCLSETLRYSPLYPKQTKDNGGQRQEAIAKNEIHIVATKMDKFSQKQRLYYIGGYQYPAPDCKKYKIPVNYKIMHLFFFKQKCCTILHYAKW